MTAIAISIKNGGELRYENITRYTFSPVSAQGFLVIETVEGTVAYVAQDAILRITAVEEESYGI